MVRYSFFFVLFSAVCIYSPEAQAQAIIADRTTVDLSLIPDGALSLARNLKVHLRRASVGGNIDDGLNAIQTENSIKYNRSNWVFYARGNPGWEAKVNEFAAFVDANLWDYDVFSMKFCWIDPDAVFAAYRDTLLRLESTYTGKRFVWWTMPITRDVDGSEASRQVFNDSVRAYASANGKFLFDIADIEATTAAGEKKTDGSGHELQQDAWSSDGGHLNDAGARRVASAWWWLMARAAGWNGATSVDMTSFATPTEFALNQNYPNPFNPTTTIKYDIPNVGTQYIVSLRVYDILGKEVATLVNETREAGSYKVNFDASRLSSGVYFYKMTSGLFTAVKKLVLMK
jgi:hypothetical protein